MRALPLFALAFALVACSSCSSSSSSTQAPRTDAASDTNVQDTSVDTIPIDTATCTLLKPYSTKDTACNACAQSHCCAEVNGCLGDKRCDDAYVNCILACALLPDDAGADASAATAACLDDCASKSPEGKAEYDTAIGCVDAACKGTCK